MIAWLYMVKYEARFAQAIGVTGALFLWAVSLCQYGLYAGIERGAGGAFGRGGFGSPSRLSQSAQRERHSQTEDTL
jgi:hypothetical protein